MEGTHIHTNSFRITAAPVMLKNASPIGEETMGRQGRKYRAELNGAKKATPRVPSTIASNTACDMVETKNNTKRAFRLIPSRGFLKASSTTIPLRHAANKNECVSPR